MTMCPTRSAEILPDEVLDYLGERYCTQRIRRLTGISFAAYVAAPERAETQADAVQRSRERRKWAGRRQL